METRPLVELRKHYKCLFMTTFRDLPGAGSSSFLFRPLSLSEYNQYRGILTSNPLLLPIVEDEILDRCVIQMSIPPLEAYTPEYVEAITREYKALDDVLHPIDLLPAGVVTSFINMVFFVSYPKSVDEWNGWLWRERQSQGIDIEYKLKGFACSMFGCTPQELDDLSCYKLVELVVMGEGIATNRTALPIQIAEPEPEIRKPGVVSKAMMSKIDAEAAQMRRALGAPTAVDRELKARLDKMFDRTEAVVNRGGKTPEPPPIEEPGRRRRRV